MSRGKLVAILFLLILLAMPGRRAWSRQQGDNAGGGNIGNFVGEIMVLKIDSAGTQLAMWFPYEFFIAAGRAEGRVTREQVERDLGFLKPYITIVVQNKLEQPDGTSTYLSEQEVRARAALRLDDGTQVLPLDDVPPRVAATVAAMKAIFTKDGQGNSHIIIFPNSTKQGKQIVSETQRDKLTLVLKPARKFAETTFTWRTPFDAVTSASNCPRCKAGLSAKWSYCPYCGLKIVQ